MKNAFAIAVLASLCAQAQPDALIEAARKAAAVYAQSLPDYVVKRSTSRYRNSQRSPVRDASNPKAAPPASVDAGTGTQLVDTITGDVAVDRGKEVYTNIQVNGAPAKDLPRGGSWSAGEFAGEIPMVFSSENAAVFSHQHAETLRGHSVMRYDFAVAQAHSTWNMAAANTGFAGSNLSFSPAYSGKVWIDKETGQAISIEMIAQGLPRGFPVSSVESRTEYEFVKIGDARFLLPVHSETESCEPGGAVCLKNVTDFKDFKKFESSTNISFDH